MGERRKRKKKRLVMVMRGLRGLGGRGGRGIIFAACAGDGCTAQGHVNPIDGVCGNELQCAACKYQAECVVRCQHKVTYRSPSLTGALGESSLLKEWDSTLRAREHLARSRTR